MEIEKKPQLPADMQEWRKQTATAAGFLIVVIEGNTKVPEIARAIAIGGIRAIVAALLR